MEEACLSCLSRLTDPTCWEDFLARHEAAHPRRTRTHEAYRALLPHTGRMAGAVLSCRYWPGEPRRVLLNRMDGRRKRLVHVYPPADELVLKLCCHLACRYDPLLPDACHAFRPGRSARSAFTALSRYPGLSGLACIRLDIADFFNAIPPERALAALPDEMRKDGPLWHVLSSVVLPPDPPPACAPPCGVKPGTPVAPILANHYLAAFDRRWMATGWPYARYSDDIVLFVPPERLMETFETMERELAALGLALNRSKTSLHAAGEPWEFLGFRWFHGRIDLSDAAIRKLKNRIRRLARRLNRYRVRRDVSPDRILVFFFRRLNGRLFGYEGRGGRFCWARWYMPVLNTAASLRALDAFIEDEARYAATGRMRLSDRRRFPRVRLKEAGLKTLVSFFYDRRWQISP